MITKEKLLALMCNNSTLHPIIKDVVRETIGDVLKIEAEQFIDCNQETLKNGKNRLILNGFMPNRDLMSPIGLVSVAAPRVRDMKPSGDLHFQSQYLPRYLRRTEDLSNLIPWLYLKGLSEADFHTVYSAVYGDEIKGLSQSTISHLVHAWDHEFNEWNKRDMSDEIYPYLWCDGIYFSVRNDKANKCQLVIVGVNENGQKKLVANGESYSESDDGWTALFLRLKHQGMPDPKLLIGDAGLGLWAGLKGVYPDCSRQHCWFHKQLNIRKLLPKSQQTYATHLVRSIYNSDTKEEALKQAKLFYDTFSGKYPKAVSSLKDNINNLLTFYDFPARHWTQIRTSNIIESLFSTVRARTNVTRGKLSSSKIEILVFKLAQIASKRMNAIPAADELKMVIAGKMYKDGVMVAAKGGKI